MRDLADRGHWVGYLMLSSTCPQQKPDHGDDQGEAGHSAENATGDGA
jgi:hypothetical protein